MLYSIRSERLLWRSSTTTCSSVVRGPDHRRSCLGCHELHEEPRPPAQRGHRDAFFGEVLARSRPPACSRTSTSPSMAPCSRPGRGTRASTPKDTDRPLADGPKNPTSTSTAETRRNDTHESTTDPEAGSQEGRGQEPNSASRPSADGEPPRPHPRCARDPGQRDGGTRCRSRAARRAAAKPARHRRRRQGLRHARLRSCRPRAVTPHVAQNTLQAAARSTHGRPVTPGYAVSQRIRKRVEQSFGWTKTVGGSASCDIGAADSSIGCFLRRRRVQPGALAESRGATG